MHHRHTGTGQAGPLGTPMYRLEACESRLGAVTRGTLYALQTSVAGRVSFSVFEITSGIPGLNSRRSRPSPGALQRLSSSGEL